ncbi:PPC domain-containing protein [Halomarina rubra]|uniref:PPC domain-containing protein n=1 Tax=Halomarina rubra TaxID=2071873 RepID=A0ABD6AZF5_9EURY|nr:PPC domain-containing protein [Halomarina rubra]
MRPRRPASTPARSRTRTALPRILALTLALTVVLGGMATAISVGAAAQDGGNAPTAISTGQSYDESLSENDTSDSFTFSAEQGEYIRLGSITGSPSTMDATIYTPSGETLDSYDVYVEWILLGAQAPETGEYTVEFDGGGDYPSSDPADYSFKVTTVGPDSYESNDAMSSATTLSETTTVDAELTEGDDDWFALEAAEGTGIVADLDRDENLLDNSYTIEILDESGTVLAETSSQCTPGAGPCNPRGVSTNAPADGTYYVHVSGGVRGYDAYEMWTSFQQPENETTEQVDDGDPKSASPGNSYDDTVSQSDTTDTYTVDVEEGNYLRVSALAGTPDVMSVTVTGPSGNTFDSAEMGPDAVQVGGLATTGGEYTVEYTYDGDLPEEDPQSYQFGVDTASPDSYESNDAMSSAAAMSSDSLDAVLGDGDTDYYAVSAAANSTIDVSLDWQGYVTNSFDYRIVDGDGNVLDEDRARCTPGTNCGGGLLSATVPQDGEYYVVVGGDGITGFNHYSLTVDAEAPSQDTETPDDTETPEDTETPDETETPDDTTEAPEDGSGDDADDSDSDTDSDGSDDTSTPESGDGSETDDSDDSSDSDDGTDDQSSDDSSSDDSDTSDDPTDDSTDDTSSDTSDDSDTSSETDDSSDDGSDSTSGTNDGSDSSSDSDVGSGDDSSSSDETNTDGESDTDSGTSDGADDTTTPAPTTSEPAPTTDGGSATTTTDGEDVAAGPAAPVSNNNSTEGVTDVVRGGDSETTDSSSGFGPGFGVVAALVALVAAALLARRQQ